MSLVTYTAVAYLYTGGPCTTEKLYDEGGNQARQVSFTYGPEGESLSISGNTTPHTVAYDALYRVVQETDGNQHTTSAQFNTAGYLSLVTYPDQTTCQYTSFDANGDPLKCIDQRAVEADYTYTDPASALTDIKYPATPAINVHAAYDGYGRAESMTDGTGSAAWTFDDGDRALTTSTTYTGLPQQTLTYSYWQDGSRKSLDTPAGNFSYSYDGIGRRTGLINALNESFSWSFLDNDWLWTQTSANAVTETLTYNARGFITELKNTLPGNDSTLSDFGAAIGSGNEMFYDAAGDRLSMLASVPSDGAYSGLTGYQFDGVSRATQEQSARNGGYTNGFGYDGAANPTTMRGTGYTFNSVNENSLWGYDQAGNPTTFHGVACQYDAENRMTAYGTVLTAGYTGDGLRAWKTTAAGTTYFIYDGRIPLYEMNASGQVTAVNTFSFNLLLSRHSGGSSVFYSFDPNHSVCQRLDGSGNVLSSEMYDAYGARYSSDGNTDPFGFLGQLGYYTDAETGLQWVGSRYYDPASGEFATRDVSGLETNLYAYCADNPVIGADPSGCIHCYFDNPAGCGHLTCWTDPGDIIGVQPGSPPWDPFPGITPITSQGGQMVVDCTAGNKTVGPNNQPTWDPWGPNGPVPPGNWRLGPPEFIPPSHEKARRAEGHWFIPLDALPGRHDSPAHPTHGCARTTQPLAIPPPTRRGRASPIP